jgi:hypothetical protein
MGLARHRTSDLRRESPNVLVAVGPKPSDGLEPSTPPYHFWGWNRGQARVTATTKAPQARRIRERDVARAWTSVVALVFAPRSHGEGKRSSRSRYARLEARFVTVT